MKSLAALTAPTLGLALALTGCAGSVSRAPTEPLVQRSVSEDDQVRITELRVRGQVQAIGVENKGSALPGYQVTPAAGGSDPSAAKGGAGQRVWNVLQF
jgi:hypothetical protein